MIGLLVVTLLALNIRRCPRSPQFGRARSARRRPERLRRYPITLTKTAPLLLTGLSIVVAWRAGMFSIGAEGQLLIGALAATALWSAAPKLPPIVLVVAMMFVAAQQQAPDWGGAAGWLRVRRGVPEVISTIMLNYIALDLIGALVTRGPGGFMAELSPARTPIRCGRDLTAQISCPLRTTARRHTSISGHPDRRRRGATRRALSLPYARRLSPSALSARIRRRRARPRLPIDRLRMQAMPYLRRAVRPRRRYRAAGSQPAAWAATFRTAGATPRSRSRCSEASLPEARWSPPSSSERSLPASVTRSDLSASPPTSPTSSRPPRCWRSSRVAPGPGGVPVRRPPDARFDGGRGTLQQTLTMATPLLLAALGENVTQRSGVVNVGIEGMMLGGAFCANPGNDATGNPLLGVAAGAAAGALVASLFAVIAVRMAANQIVVGIIVNLLAQGIRAPSTSGSSAGELRHQYGGAPTHCRRPERAVPGRDHGDAADLVLAGRHEGPACSFARAAKSLPLPRPPE